MIFNIPKGVLGSKNTIVELSDTAKSFGSGMAEVYATPAMIALMENTAFDSVEVLLPDGFSTVGISINVQHLKASLPGTKILCKSKVIGVDGNKITFEISANDNFGKIGTAENIRYIINSDDFMNKINNPKARPQGMS